MQVGVAMRELARSVLPWFSHHTHHVRAIASLALKYYRNHLCSTHAAAGMSTVCACPHTPIYVHVLLCMCAHATRYVSWYCRG